LKLPGVPYDHIRLECDAQHFYRAAELETSPDAKTWQFAARGTIYQTADQSSLGLGFVERHDRYLRLRIFNRDDRPMSVRRVVVETTARLVKFAVVHSEGRFLLFTGNPDAKAPSYDFAAVLEREAPQPDVRATLLAPSVNPGYHPLPAPQKPWSERYPQLLYGTLAVAIAVMGYIAIRYLLKIKSASP
jgi:hypothetical protein